MEAGKGAGVGCWVHITIGLGDTWAPWMNKDTSSDLDMVPGCTEEGARPPLHLGSAPSARGRGSCLSDSLLHLGEASGGEKLQTIWQGKGWEGGGVGRGPCVERMVPAREEVMGRAPWGKPLTSGSQLAATALMGGTSGVKGKGQGT